MAGLLACSLLLTFPSRHVGTVVRSSSNSRETAIGNRQSAKKLATQDLVINLKLRELFTIDHSRNELTAAGQPRNCTGFPFNPPAGGTDNGRKVGKKVQGLKYKV